MWTFYEIRRENWGPCIPPFKVTQGHRNWHRSIGYLGLPVCGPLTIGLSWTVYPSEILMGMGLLGREKSRIMVDALCRSADKNSGDAETLFDVIWQSANINKFVEKTPKVNADLSADVPPAVVKTATRVRCDCDVIRPPRQLRATACDFRASNVSHYKGGMEPNTLLPESTS